MADQQPNYQNGDDDDEEEEYDVINVESGSESESESESEEEEEEDRSKRIRLIDRKAERDNDNSNNDDNGESSQGYNRNNSQIEGLFCPICFDAWTSEGDHRICCLACGHLFGFSCIIRWLKEHGSRAKCPQCNRRFTSKDVRKLFAPRLAVVDEESQKTIRSLELKCDALEKKDAEWRKKESEWKKKEADFRMAVDRLRVRTDNLEHPFRELQSQSDGTVPVGMSYQEHAIPGNFSSNFSSQVWSSCFVLERELPVNGARLFDIEAFGQVLLLARRLPKIGSHVLTKMNLLPPHETEDIFLPSSMKMIKDLRISPFNRRHALCASLGKKLSIVSMENNGIVLSCDLPAPAWSCSWDVNSSNYIYAGLQNGSLSAFDIRQTGRELESRLGLTNNPIHTLHSLQDNSSRTRKLLSASSIGLCQWDFDRTEQRPSLIPEAANQEVCISVAYCPPTNDIIATYRPKVDFSNEMTCTQPQLTPSPVIGQGVTGSHLYLKRMDDKYQKSGTVTSSVSNIRLPKSVIVNMNSQNPLFATGDEALGGLIFQELPSFRFAQRLKLPKHVVYDVKYKSTSGLGLLGCLTEDTLQLFSSNIT